MRRRPAPRHGTAPARRLFAQDDDADARRAGDGWLRARFFAAASYFSTTRRARMMQDFDDACKPLSMLRPGHHIARRRDAVVFGCFSMMGARFSHIAARLYATMMPFKTPRRRITGRRRLQPCHFVVAISF